METEKCKHCGALLSEKAKFCFECGTIILRNKQEESVSESQNNSSAEKEPSVNTASDLKAEENKPIKADENNDKEKTDTLVQNNNEQQNGNRQTQQNDRQENTNQKNRFTGSEEQFNPYITPPPPGSKYASVSLWSYVGMMILFSLPIIGFILAIVWSFDSNNINRRNYARAVLVLLAITIILSVVISVVGFVLLYDVIKEMMESFPQNGFTIPFDQYDIKIDGLIDGLNSKNGAFIYRYIGDIKAF